MLIALFRPVSFRPGRLKRYGSSGIPGGSVGTTSQRVESFFIGTFSWIHACSFVRIARSPTVVNIQNLIDDRKCFEPARELRWPEGVTCPHCASGAITKQGHDSTQPGRQRYTIRTQSHLGLP